MIIWFILMTSMSLIQRWWSKEIKHARYPQFLQSLWRRAKRQLLKSLWWPIYVINSVDNNKLPCEELTDERMSFPEFENHPVSFFSSSTSQQIVTVSALLKTFFHLQYKLATSVCTLGDGMVTSQWELSFMAVAQVMNLNDTIVAR